MRYSSCTRNLNSWISGIGGRKWIVCIVSIFFLESGVAQSYFISPSLQMNWKQRWAQPSNKPLWNHIPSTAWISAPPTAILTSWRCPTPKALPQQGDRSVFALDGNLLLLVWILSKVIINFQVTLSLSVKKVVVFYYSAKSNISSREIWSCQYPFFLLKIL